MSPATLKTSGGGRGTSNPYRGNPQTESGTSLEEMRAPPFFFRYSTNKESLMIKTSRIILLFMVFSFVCGSVTAQTWPERSITLIVPFAPGASADGIARLLATELGASLGKPVVVENRPGAGGATGLIAVSKANPDGHTFGLGATGAIAVNPHIPDSPPLDPLRDLTPVAKLADIPLVMIAGRERDSPTPNKLSGQRAPSRRVCPGGRQETIHRNTSVGNSLASSPVFAWSTFPIAAARQPSLTFWQERRLSQ